MKMCFLSAQGMYILCKYSNLEIRIYWFLIHLLDNLNHLICILTTTLKTWPFGMHTGDDAKLKGLLKDWLIPIVWVVKSPYLKNDINSFQVLQQDFKGKYFLDTLDTYQCITVVCSMIATCHIGFGEAQNFMIIIIIISQALRFQIVMSRSFLPFKIQMGKLLINLMVTYFHFYNVLYYTSTCTVYAY